MELKLSVRRIEDWLLNYGCKDSEILCWKLKTLRMWLFLFSSSLIVLDCVRLIILVDKNSWQFSQFMALVGSNGNQPLDWLKDACFMHGLKISAQQSKQKKKNKKKQQTNKQKKSAQRSNWASMATQWTRGGGNQAQGRKKSQTHWQIQIILTERNQYRAQIFMYA